MAGSEAGWRVPAGQGPVRAGARGIPSLFPDRADGPTKQPGWPNRQDEHDQGKGHDVLPGRADEEPRVGLQEGNDEAGHYRAAHVAQPGQDDDRPRDIQRLDPDKREGWELEQEG